MSGSTPNLVANLPLYTAPIVTPGTGIITEQWYYLLQRLLARTGGTVGSSTGDAGAAAAAAQTTANSAVIEAAAAQSTANTAQTTANTAQTTANTANIAAATAQATANTALTDLAAETARAEAAEALRALINNPVFTGLPPVFPLFTPYANDAAAAAGGIVLGQVYYSSTVLALTQRRI